ncbi:recombination regulator RecX [Derxia gummosa]|uniref:Regulatory protein RecX n=1 Tax=Derxia gummosa DSM 723 TaxID=1121388 RepID=A0A8B6X1D9_9BURK|nr:recombination regulator RecX [Derxia gummosa]
MKGRAPTGALSLKARALRALSLREHSRAELGRKLAPHAESAEQLASLLDALEAERLLSNDRFAESLVRRRAERFGTARIKAELRTHALAPEVIEHALGDCAASEAARAREVWAKRFGMPAEDAAGRAKQARFLAARGFSAAVVRAIVSGIDDSD